MRMFSIFFSTALTFKMGVASSELLLESFAMLELLGSCEEELLATLELLACELELLATLELLRAEEELPIIATLRAGGGMSISLAM